MPRLERSFCSYVRNANQGLLSYDCACGLIVQPVCKVTVNNFNKCCYEDAVRSHMWFGHVTRAARLRFLHSPTHSPGERKKPEMIKFRAMGPQASPTLLFSRNLATKSCQSFHRLSRLLAACQGLKTDGLHST